MSEDRDGIDDAHEDDLEQEDLDTEDLDAGSEDDLPEDDPDEGGDDAEPVGGAPAPQPSRAQARIQALEQRAKEAERREAEATRRAEEATRRQSTEDFRRQEQERLENMSEGERIEYRVNQRLNEIQFNSWNTGDRVVFDGLVRDNPAVAAIKDEVEQVFQDRIKSGQPVDRSTIATFLIGQKALSKQPRAKAAGKRAEQAGRERNSVRPTSGRSDAASGGRTRMSEQEARRKRLEDVTF